MNRLAQFFVQRPRTDADLIELAYHQLKLIFPFIDKQYELKTQKMTSVLVDIIAHSESGQIIIFEVREISHHTIFGYAEYPPIALLQNDIRQIAPDKPPIVVVLTSGRINELVQNLFAKSNIPLITIGRTPIETKVRLHEAFQRNGIHLSEFTLPPEQDELEVYLSSVPYWEESSRLARLDKIRLSSFVYLMMPILVLGAELVFQYTSTFTNLVIFAFAAIMGIYLTLRDIRRNKLCINPNLIVERDQRRLIVKENEWVLERRIIFKARRKVDEYLFKLDWTGSSQNVIINCENEYGRLAKKTFVNSAALHKQLWALHFEKPIRTGEIREIVLRCIFPDPEHKAMPYHIFSYNNVWKCKEFECRLALAKNLQPNAVWLVRGTKMDVAFNKTEISPDLYSNEYVVHERPNSASLRYSMEWELKNGKSKSQH